MGTAHILQDSSLVDAEKELLPVDGVRKGIEPLYLLLTAPKPSGGPGHGLFDIRPVRQSRRALVKGHGYGGAQIGLDLHAFLRSHKDLVSVDMGAEVDAFLLDLPEGGQGKYLKSAGVRQHRSVPVHEPAQAPELPDQLISGTDMKVIGVGQLHLAPDLLQVHGGNRSLYGTHGAYIHKDGRLYDSMDCLHVCRFRPSFFSNDLILHYFTSLAFSAAFIFLLWRPPSWTGTALAAFSLMCFDMSYQRGPVMQTEE